MNKDAKIVKLKLDIIFKKIFGAEENTDIISSFVADLLEMPRDEIKNIEMKNVELMPDIAGHKFSRVDLKMLVNNEIINIELQVHSESDFRDRTLFYWAKIFSGQLPSGVEYGDLRKTICINILNFSLFERQRYHSQYEITEKKDGELYTDKFSIHFFELNKLNKSRNSKPAEEWLDLINAETEDDLAMIEKIQKVSQFRRLYSF